MRGNRNWHLRRSSASSKLQRKMLEWEGKDDQDRKRHADDTIEQNDQSRPKEAVGRPVKKVPPEERTPGCKECRGESHYHIQACTNSHLTHP